MIVYGGKALKPDLKSEQIDILFDSILKLKTREECYAFFTDVCTVSELKALGQRNYVAGLLMDNATYNEIVNKTGASTATISRVKRSIEYGEGGYELVAKRLNK